MRKKEYEEIIAFHPGYYIKNLLEDEGMSQEELAKRLDVTPKCVSELVNGLTPLSSDMATRLSYVFNTSISMWLSLQMKYEEKRQEIEKRENLALEASTVKMMKYQYWVSLGVVKDAKKNEERAEELQRYLGIASLSSLKNKDHLVSFRQSNKDIEEKNIINANAWVLTAIRFAEKEETAPYEEAVLKKSLSEMRSLTRSEPSYFVTRLRDILKCNGVALVLLPYLEDSKIHGVSKWLSHDKAMIALSDRLKSNDVFWFSFFHELGHVFQRKLKSLSINANSEIELSEKEQKLELEADAFARNALIPEKEYERFLRSGNYRDRESIIRFAEEIDIDPGIVVGRLQKDKKLTYKTSLNDLKKQYEIVI